MSGNTDMGTDAYTRYINGDDTAMTELLSCYWDGLLWYLNSILGNLHLAEEAAEEAFVKLAVQKPVFHQKSSFRTWLYAIGRNAAMDLLRKHKREQDLLSQRSLATTESAEAAFFREEQKLQLHHAMTRLKPEYRQVLYLRYFALFDHKETARVMHKTTRQIENLLYRAKISLRKHLEKEGFVYEEL